MSGNEKYMCFADFEFTCGSPMYRMKSEMLSVGLIICDSEYNITEKFYATSKPNRFPKLSKQCRELTHLTQDEISSSPDSEEVLSRAAGLLKDYGIKEIFVWGNFDKPGLKSDIRQHKFFHKENRSIVKICDAVRDIQDETIQQMNLPQAVSVSELASAFGYEPYTGSFHNAFDDAMALYTIHRNVNTTDFSKNPAFIHLKEERLEKIRAVKEAQEEKKRLLAFSIPLSEEEALCYEELSAELKRKFICLRSKIILAFKKYPDTEDFIYIIFNNSKTFKIAPRQKYNSGLIRTAVDVHYFTRENFRSFMLESFGG